MQLQPEKVAFYILIPLSIGAFLFTIINFQYTIKKPFLRKVVQKVDVAEPEQSGEFATSPEALQALKDKDTDKDGLFDYDELYVYRTSPYLADSDSDKINDKEEVAKGEDPNCPKDKVCKESAPSKVQDNIQSTLPQFAPFPGQTSLDKLPAIDSVVPQNLSTKEIRELLKQAGMDQKTLDQVDDEALLKIYKETIGEMGKQSQ